MADADRSEALQSFLAITGTEDAEAATRTLDATNWDLEAAVNLHFVAGAGDGGGGAGAGGLGADMPPGLLAGDAEDGVRAPLPTRTERLFGDAGMHMPMMHPAARYGMGGGDRAHPAAAAAGAAATRPGASHVDAFRDFKAEEGAAASGSGPGSAGLSSLFQPPTALMFKGSFEQAKAAAAEGAGRWLLVNVQSGTEFASHRLNRDTWRHKLVVEMVGGSFLFHQVYDSSPDGGSLMGMYGLTEVPATFIVDPVTGGKMWQRDGFLSADALIEELIPFLDCGPNDPGAASLAQASAVRPQRRGGGGGGGPSVPAAAMTEDEQMAAAIAASMEAGGAAKRRHSDGEGDAAGSDDDEDDADAAEEAAIWAEIERRQKAEAAAAAAGGAGAATAAAAAATAAVAAAAPAAPPAAPPGPDPAAVAAAAAEAAARLPPEPEEGAAGACRVALRLPGGERAQRRFPAAAPASVVFDFARSVCPDAAAGRAFDLREAMPGAAFLAEAPAAGGGAGGASLADAGLANAMLVLSWREG